MKRENEASQAKMATPALQASPEAKESPACRVLRAETATEVSMGTAGTPAHQEWCSAGRREV